LEERADPVAAVVDGVGGGEGEESDRQEGEESLPQKCAMHGSNLQGWKSCRRKDRNGAHRRSRAHLLSRPRSAESEAILEKLSPKVYPYC
jgi:hypothetical protein